ncbi:hypothetical protein ACSAZL_01125 [Methanosarcina sp. T3]|uniref:hypothetical protein n=1 Tax=Methanosarcina sp. T3 TaxID=3439062 RepID=UPI003F8541D3
MSQKTVICPYCDYHGKPTREIKTTEMLSYCPICEKLIVSASFPPERLLQIIQEAF